MYVHLAHRRHPISASCLLPDFHQVNFILNSSDSTGYLLPPSLNLAPEKSHYQEPIIFRDEAKFPLPRPSFQNKSGQKVPYFLQSEKKKNAHSTVPYTRVHVCTHAPHTLCTCNTPKTKIFKGNI